MTETETGARRVRGVQMKRLVIAAALNFLVAQAFAEPTMVLGVPLGERLTLATCPLNKDLVKKPCWDGSPSRAKKGGRAHGSVHLPAPDSRPRWAAYGLFELALNEDSQAESLKFQTLDLSDAATIIQSISSRFGKPTSSGTFTGGAWADWRSQEGGVKMQCGRERCWVTFRTPTAQDAYDQAMAKLDAKEAARPETP